MCQSYYMSWTDIFLHIGPRKRVRRLAATRRRGGRDRLLPPGLLWSACQSENADVVHYILDEIVAARRACYIEQR